MLDATSLGYGISVGSRPRPGYYGALYNVIVLVAEEYQPPSSAFPGVRVRHFPFHDSTTPTQDDFMIAWAAATAVANDVARGRGVLVSCNLGRNRSALVAALALHMLTGITGAEALDYVRKRRVDPTGSHALTNRAFREFLREIR